MRRTASPVSSALRVVTVVLVHSTRCGLRRAGPILTLAHILFQNELYTRSHTLLRIGRHNQKVEARQRRR